MSLPVRNVNSDDVGVVDTMVFGSLPSGITISRSNNSDRLTSGDAKSSLKSQVPLPKKPSGIMGTIVATIF